LDKQGFLVDGFPGFVDGQEWAALQGLEKEGHLLFAFFEGVYVLADVA
jgi:hypothetical protein